MKKLLFGGLGIIILIAAVGVLRRGGNDTAIPSPSPSPVASAEVTVVVVSAEVSVKEAANADFKSITGQVKLGPGSELKTSASGRARLLYPNGTTAAVNGDGYIKIQSVDKGGNQSRIELVSGNMWSKIKSILGADDYYEVETENVVASVRGTAFVTEFRNGVSNVYGIESKVRIRAKDPKKREIIEGTDAEVLSGEKVSVSNDKLPPAKRAIAKQLFSDEDYRKQFIKRHIVEELDREDVLKDERTKQMIRTIVEKNQNDKEFIRKIIERRLQDATIPTLSPKVSSTPLPGVTATPSTTSTPQVTLSPTPTTTPTPTPDTTPVIESVFPKTIGVGAEFTVNGKNFTAGRNVSQISAVSVGGASAPFKVLDSLTIFVTAPSVSPGTHDVIVTTTGGDKLTQSITVQ